MRLPRIFVVPLATLLLLSLSGCGTVTVPAGELPQAGQQEAEGAESESEASTTGEQPVEPTAEELVLVPTATAEAAAVDEGEAVAEAPTSEPVAEEIDWTTVAAVEGDYFVRGNPNAPIRLIDYSDFL